MPMQQLQKVSTGFSTSTLFLLSVSIVFICSMIVVVNCSKKKKRRPNNAHKVGFDKILEYLCKFKGHRTNKVSNNDRMVKGSKTRAFFKKLNPLEETNETDLGSFDDIKRIKDENIKLEHSQPTISQQTGTLR
uniref:Uncharacterized protein n=1 Tax=Meloidogyne hapla TaxID=6305 RepID=A0A1I8BUQ7_MELHA